jgi:hypothetical protein
MQRTTPFQIYKLLEKSNCRKCGKQTCMAYAAALISGEADIEDCPRLDEKAAEALRGILVVRSPRDDFYAVIEALRKDVAALNFNEIAGPLGAEVEDGRLVMTCLGKDFVVNPDGTMESQCHVNPWVEAMLFSYCTSGGTGRTAGEWVTYERLGQGAAAIAAYFERRVAEPLKYVADEHGPIFWDLMTIFDGERAEGFPSDEAWVLHPLPKVPFLILYTGEEEGQESRLRVLMDKTAADYLRPEVITYTGRGMVEMFKKIIAHHQDHTDKLLFV